MSDPTRRGFLKGIGGALTAAGVAASSGSTAAAAPQAQSTALSTVSISAQQTRSARMVIRPEQLELLVAETLADLVARGVAFTAYDVTSILRRRHPGVNIMHPAVRSAVHRRMEPAVASSSYACEMIRYRSGDAVRYVCMRT